MFSVGARVGARVGAFVGEKVGIFVGAGVGDLIHADGGTTTLGEPVGLSHSSTQVAFPPTKAMQRKIYSRKITTMK